MNLSFPPSPSHSAPQQPGPTAKVYTTDGRSVRVPLRPTQSTACTQQPERQFMQWFTRQAAANPSFPAMVKNVLLIVANDETPCDACQQAMSGFLQRFRLRDKLHVRRALPSQSRRNARFAYQPVQTELDQLVDEQSGEMEGEFELEQEFTATDVIHPNIDVHAQYAIQRMLKSPDPAARDDGAGMLGGVRSGTLGGIYKEDQQVPALWARRHGSGWWQLISADPNIDVAVLLEADPANPAAWKPPLIIFRDKIRSLPDRLDAGLRVAWQLVLNLNALKASRPALTPPQAWTTLTGTSLPLSSPRNAAIFRILR